MKVEISKQRFVGQSRRVDRLACSLCLIVSLTLTSGVTGTAATRLADDELVVQLAAELKANDLLAVHRVIRKIKKTPRLHVRSALLLMQNIKDSKRKTSFFAADALVELGPGKAPGSITAAMISHQVSLIKFVGLSWAAKSKQIPAAAIEPLLRLWSDPRWQPRMAAVMKKLAGRKDVVPVVKAMVPLLKNRDPMVQFRAASFLGRMGKKALAAKNQLTAARNMSIPAVAAMAAVSLFLITGEQQTNQDFWLKALRSDDDGTRYYAMVAMLRLGKAGLPWFDEITKLFAHQNRTMRQQAGALVARMGTEVIPKVIKLLKSPDPLVRSSAAFALGEMHQQAKSATQALMAAYHDDDAKVRGEVISALGGIGRAAKDATPIIVAALQDADKETRQTAGTAIWLVARRADLSAPYLISFVDDKKNPVPQREYFINMLIDLAPHSKLVEPAMLRWLDDKQPGVRTAACVALGKIKRHTSKVMIALKKKLDDKVIDVQREAVRAILALEDTQQKKK